MHHAVISTILRHGSKQTSYKIALLWSLNDVVLAYPDVGHDGRPVAVPPRALRDLGEVQALPGATAADVCVVVQPDLWRAFHDVSLWAAALRLHEWSQFTERVSGTVRGEAYVTERPDNRLQLEWARNQVDLLMLEGAAFACPGPVLGSRRAATISTTSSRFWCTRSTSCGTWCRPMLRSVGTGSVRGCHARRR